MSTKHLPYAVRDWNDRTISRHKSLAAAEEARRAASHDYPATCYVTLRSEWVEHMQATGREYKVAAERHVLRELREGA